MSPTAHVCDVVKAHKRANLILRTFESRDMRDIIVRAYLVYVRPIVEYNSIIWSPYTVKDIQAK